MDPGATAKRTILWGTCCILAGLFLAACSPSSSPAPGGATDEATAANDVAANSGSTSLRRGHLVIGHEVRSFEPCGAQGDLWVLDETEGVLAGVYEELTYEPYQRLYVEVLGQEGARPDEGFGADYDGSIVVSALRHAALESLACDGDLAAVLLRASGNEPFWRVDILADEILLSELGQEDRLFSSLSAEAREDGLRQFRGAAVPAPGQRIGEDGESIVVTLDEHPCRDSMSGAYFSFAARVEVDGRELAGCARQGW